MIYGPQSSDMPACGACKFTFDSNGDYQPVCENLLTTPGGKLRGLFGGEEGPFFCGSMDPAFDLGAVPDLLRPVSSDISVDGLFKRAADAGKHKAVPSRGSKRIKDFVPGKEEEGKDAAAVDAEETKPVTKAETKGEATATETDTTTTTSTSSASKADVDVDEALRASQAQMYAAAKKNVDKISTPEAELRELRMRPSSTSSSTSTSTSTSTSNPVDAEIISETNTAVDEDSDSAWSQFQNQPIGNIMPKEMVSVITNQIEAAGVSKFPMRTQVAYKKYQNNDSFTISDLTDLLMMTRSESEELFDLLQQKQEGKISGMKASMQMLKVVSSLDARFKDIARK
jgi:hypothetical protein